MSLVDFIPKEPSKDFEISLIVRDALGNPTRKKKSYASDDAFEIWRFWMRNKGRPKRKKGKVPTAKEADKFLKDLYKQEDEDTTQEESANANLVG